MISWKKIIFLSIMLFGGLLSSNHQLFLNETSNKTSSNISLTVLQTRRESKQYIPTSFIPLQGLTNHAPISIGYNAMIASYKSSGTGTASDPYLISGLDITNTTYNLIIISNTNAYLVIQDCLLNDSYNHGIGIELTNVTNLVINNVEITGTSNAIYGLDTSSVTIENSYIHNIDSFSSGIYQLNSNSSIYTGNKFELGSLSIAFYLNNTLQDSITFNSIQNSYRGIYTYYSNFTSINDNSLVNITTQNAMGLYYDFNNSIESNIFSNANTNGIYVSGSDYNLFQNNTFTKIVGISIEFQNYCIYNSLLNNSISNTSIGFDFFNSNNNLIKQNVILDPHSGIILLSSSNNTVEDNNILSTSSSLYDLEISGSNFNLVKNNILSSSSTGIYLSGSNFNSIMNDTMENSPLLLNLENSNWNNISQSSFLKSLGNGTELDNSAFNTISNCTFDSSMNYTVVLNNGTGTRIILNAFEGANYYSLFLVNEKNALVEFNYFFGKYVAPYERTQAFDNGTNNLFSFNYWNGWASPDSDHDGFVDIPLIIDGIAHSEDLFPLTSPGELTTFYNTGIISFTNSTAQTSTTSVLNYQTNGTTSTVTITNNSPTSSDYAAAGLIAVLGIAFGLGASIIIRKIRK